MSLEDRSLSYRAGFASSGASSSVFRSAPTSSCLVVEFLEAAPPRLGASGPSGSGGSATPVRIVHATSGRPQSVEPVLDSHPRAGGGTGARAEDSISRQAAIEVGSRRSLPPRLPRRLGQSRADVKLRQLRPTRGFQASAHVAPRFGRRRCSRRRFRCRAIVSLTTTTGQPGSAMAGYGLGARCQREVLRMVGAPFVGHHRQTWGCHRDDPTFTAPDQSRAFTGRVVTHASRSLTILMGYDGLRPPADRLPPSAYHRLSRDT